MGDKDREGEVLDPCETENGTGDYSGPRQKGDRTTRGQCDRRKSGRTGEDVIEEDPKSTSKEQPRVTRVVVEVLRKGSMVCVSSGGQI